MQKEACLLGVDIGGTGCKTTGFTVDGCIVGEGYQEYMMITV